MTRIGDVLPQNADAFLADRTAREVVTFNLFLGLQEAIALATHWLADAGIDVPETYGDVFTALGEHRLLDAALASRLRAAAGLRNLVAHQYGVLDFRRVFRVAREDLGDLIAFCQAVSNAATRRQ